MIESINDVLKNIRERFASPFFFSFIIAWVYYNWKVTVALIWYNPDLYPDEGDLICFIERNTSNQQSFWIPLGYAILYTAFIRIGISAITELSGKLGEDLNLSITKKGKVPMEKFLTYRNLYLKSTKTLEKVIEDESKKIQEYDALNNKKIELEGKKVELEGDISTLSAVNKELTLKQYELEIKVSELNNQVKIKDEFISYYKDFTTAYNDEKKINGRWKFTYRNAFMELNFEETLMIVDNVIHRVDGGQTQGTYLIKFFFYDVPKNKIVLHLSFIPETFESKYISRHISNKERFDNSTPANFNLNSRILSSIILIQELDVRSENFLTGLENTYGIIQYERII
jgi:hypothetical protein